jgi:DNA-directed RNA polymerase specialized sigma24 family protein
MLTEVKGYLRRNGYSEDALQEGLIAAWEAELKNPGQQVGYYARVAKNGARSYLLGKKTTGRNAQGKKSLATGIPYERDTLAEMGGTYDDDVAQRMDIEAALDMLTDSEYQYVLLRFYDGYTHTEAAKYSGVSYTAWATRIKGRLANQLEDFV